MARRRPSGYWPDDHELRRTVSIRIADSVERAINRMRPSGRPLGEYIANYALPRFAKMEDQRRSRELSRIKKLSPTLSAEEILDVFYERALVEDRIRDALKIAAKMQAEGVLSREERAQVEDVLCLTMPD